jgi:hypothetical protein
MEVLLTLITPTVHTDYRLQNGPSKGATVKEPTLGSMGIKTISRLINKRYIEPPLCSSPQGISDEACDVWHQSYINIIFQNT